MTFGEFLTEELRNFYRGLPKQMDSFAPRPPVITTSERQLSPQESQKFVEQRIRQLAADPVSPSNAIPV